MKSMENEPQVFANESRRKPLLRQLMYAECKRIKDKTKADGSNDAPARYSSTAEDGRTH